MRSATLDFLELFCWRTKTTDVENQLAVVEKARDMGYEGVAVYIANMSDHEYQVMVCQELAKNRTWLPVATPILRLNQHHGYVYFVTYDGGRREGFVFVPPDYPWLYTSKLNRDLEVYGNTAIVVQKYQKTWLKLPCWQMGDSYDLALLPQTREIQEVFNLQNIKYGTRPPHKSAFIEAECKKVIDQLIAKDTILDRIEAFFYKIFN